MELSGELTIEADYLLADSLTFPEEHTTKGGASSYTGRVALPPWTVGSLHH